MLSKDFEVYYYSDFYLSQVKDHAHDYYEFYFFLEGNVGMIIEGKEYSMRQGDIVLIPESARAPRCDSGPGASIPPFCILTTKNTATVLWKFH